MSKPSAAALPTRHRLARVGLLVGVGALAGSFAVSVCFVGEASEACDEHLQQSCGEAGVPADACGGREDDDWDDDLR